MIKLGDKAASDLAWCGFTGLQYIDCTTAAHYCPIKI